MSQMIVSYYTQGVYAKEADRLRKSLDRLHLAYRLEEVPPFANWSDAVRYKPRFLARMRAIYYEVSDLLFVDADAVLWRDPWPAFAEHISLNGIPDIGVHFLNTHPQSGTIFLPAKGPRTTELLHKWIAKDAEQPVPQQPQQVLEHLLAESDYKIYALNCLLCWIFDVSPQQIETTDQPYIEHLQASRDHRKPQLSDPAARGRRHDRIREVEEALAF